MLLTIPYQERLLESHPIWWFLCLAKQSPPHRRDWGYSIPQIIFWHSAISPFANEVGWFDERVSSHATGIPIAPKKPLQPKEAKQREIPVLYKDSSLEAFMALKAASLLVMNSTHRQETPLRGMRGNVG